MPRRPFGSRIDRTVRRSAGTDSGPGPTRYPKHGPHGGRPCRRPPALTRGGCSRDDLGRRPRGGCRGGRSARESTERRACQGAPIPGRVRRVTRNTALTGAALPPPPPLPAAAVLVMTSVGDRTADAAAAVRLANRPDGAPVSGHRFRAGSDALPETRPSRGAALPPPPGPYPRRLFSR